MLVASRSFHESRNFQGWFITYELNKSAEVSWNVLTWCTVTLSLCVRKKFIPEKARHFLYKSQKETATITCLSKAGTCTRIN